jgi:hypothetical protein
MVSPGGYSSDNPVNASVPLPAAPPPAAALVVVVVVVVVVENNNGDNNDTLSTTFPWHNSGFMDIGLDLEKGGRGSDSDTVMGKYCRWFGVLNRLISGHFGCDLDGGSGSGSDDDDDDVGCSWCWLV